MGTRSGDVDPAVVFHLARQRGMEIDEIERLLNNESGLLGLSGSSQDMREIEEAALGGDQRSRLALEVFSYRVRKYIGAYFAVLGRPGVGRTRPRIGPGSQSRSLWWRGRDLRFRFESESVGGADQRGVGYCARSSGGHLWWGALRP